MPRAILVTGATGKQGGALVNALLSADFEILTVTRNGKSDAAQKLAKRSSKIRLVQGDMNDPTGLFETAKKLASGPIWGVFSVQAPFASGQSIHAEELQGKGMIDEALKHNVKFFVYTGADRGGEKSYDTLTNIPHFQTKYHIEHHLVEKSEGTELQWCILRPVAFYDNLVTGIFGKVFAKIFATSMDVALKGKPLQFIAPSDIGYIAGQAFLKPEEYKGKSISLAGDSLTHSQMAEIWKEKTGNPAPSLFKPVVSALLAFSKDLGTMFKWFHDEGYGANIEELKQLHPKLKDFAAWLDQDSQLLKR